MPVEIQILSGDRQGERSVIDASEFRAGSDRGCEVYFDPLADAGAKDRLIQFRLKDDGWWAVHSRGGDVHINQQRVTGPMRIRSGDVVRLSDWGPDFSFTLIARPRATSPAAPAAPAQTPPGDAHVPFGAMPHGTAGGASPTPSHSPGSAPETSSSHEGGSLSDARGGAPPKAPAGPPPISRAAIPQVAWVACGVAACLLVLMLARAIVPPQPAQIVVVPPTSLSGDTPPSEPTEAPKAEATPTPQPATASALAAEKPVTPSPEPPKPEMVPQPKPVEVAPAEVAPKPQPSEPPKPEGGSPPPPPPLPPHLAVQNAVYLVVAEKGGHRWPFATCCAVSKETVLTSAREAWRLAEWQADPEKGFRLWVTHSSGKVRKEIREIRVHGVFAALAAKPGDWIYFDVALLTVDGELPRFARVASAAEGGVREGMPVWCCGFFHDGGKLTDSDVLKPAMVKGKVFLITAPPNPPSNRLLHVNADIREYAYGSPIVDAQGQVVAVYGEKVPSQDKAAGESPTGLNLHYAPVISAELIEQWTTKRDEKLWITPKVTPPSSSPPPPRSPAGASPRPAPPGARD